MNSESIVKLIDLLEEISINATRYGYASARIKRCNYGSKSFLEYEKEMVEASLAVVRARVEIKKMFNENQGKEKGV